MISVTAAAHFRRGGSSASGASSQRHPFGAHCKAYGSGRIALSAPYEKEEFLTEKHSFLERCGRKKMNSIPDPDGINSPILQSLILLLNFMIKLCSLLFSIVSQLFPFFEASPSKGCHERGDLNLPLKLRKSGENLRNAAVPSSAFSKLPDNMVTDVLRWTTASDLLRAKRVCVRLCVLIDMHADELPKLLIDQVKLHFDEGEVIIYPLDERSAPTRCSMPHAEHLEFRLRHICALSLFIRGLIPIETAPVLRRLSCITIRPSQLYFLWCDFDAKCAEDCLVHLIHANQSSLTDIGFEVCTPVSLISDALFSRIDLRRLASIRVWNGGDSGGDREGYIRTTFNVAMQKSLTECEATVDGGETTVTDRFLYELARLYAVGCSQLETIDLANVGCSANGVLALIVAWYRRPPANDVHIGFHRSDDNGGGNRAAALSVELLTRCEAMGIPLTTHGLCHPNGHRLSLFVA